MATLPGGRKPSKSPPRKKSSGGEQSYRCPQCGGRDWSVSRKGNWVCGTCKTTYDPQKAKATKGSERPRTPERPAVPREDQPLEEYSYYEEEEESFSVQSDSHVEVREETVEESRDREDKVPVATSKAAAKAKVLAQARQLREEADAAMRLYRDMFGDEDEAVRNPSGATSSRIPRDEHGREVPERSRRGRERGSSEVPKPPERKARSRSPKPKKDKTDKKDRSDKKEKKAPRERAPPRENPKGKGKDKAKDRPTGWIWTEGLEWVWIPLPKGKGKPGKKGDKGKTKGKEKGRPRSRTSAAERTREAKGGRKGRRRANPPPESHPRDEEPDDDGEGGGDGGHDRRGHRSYHDDDDGEDEDDGDGPDPDDWDWLDEDDEADEWGPEEETATYDPTVDPSERNSIPDLTQLLDDQFHLGEEEGILPVHQDHHHGQGRDNQKYPRLSDHGSR